jgi:hypothetical protein
MDGRDCKIGEEVFRGWDIGEGNILGGKILMETYKTQGHEARRLEVCARNLVLTYSLRGYFTA